MMVWDAGVEEMGKERKLFSVFSKTVKMHYVHFCRGLMYIRHFSIYLA